jgi:hypothetical protein
MRSAAALLAFVLAAAAAASACGDLKPAVPDEPGAAGGDAAADGPSIPETDGGSAPKDGAVGMPDAATEASTRTGPGPHGSLPSGYCCTADSECRYRHCVDPSGSGSGPKMCVDECYDPLLCTRPDLTFTCDRPGPGAGTCKPPAGFTCLDPATFTRGPKEIGACCNGAVGGANDGTAGSICEGYTCMSSGNNPLICTHRCSFQADCPGGYVCDKFGTSKACLLLASPYTCVP